VIKIAWELALVLSLVGLAFALIFIATKLGDGHSVIKILLLFGGLFTLLLTVNVNSDILSENAVYSTNLSNQINVGYKALLYVTIFSLFYFVIYFIYNLFSSIKLKKQQEREA